MCEPGLTHARQVFYWFTLSLAFFLIWRQGLTKLLYQLCCLFLLMPSKAWQEASKGEKDVFDLGWLWNSWNVCQMFPSQKSRKQKRERANTHLAFSFFPFYSVRAVVLPWPRHPRSGWLFPSRLKLSGNIFTDLPRGVSPR